MHAEREAFPPGTEVDGYRIERRLGQGAMGTVYLATQRGTGAPRALKLLPAGTDPELEARFLREGEAMARVDGHRNVLRVFGCGRTGRHLYMALELVEGGDLDQALRRAGPMEPAQALALAAQLARGLAHVHAQGVLHRDIKPANVLVDREGTPKLTDFGLARVSGHEALTRTGSVLGSPAWMAPEQVQGLGEVDERTDVYGLGATLYALLSGRAPFGGGGAGVLVVLQQVVTQDPPPPSAWNPAVPPDLDALCLRCLAKSPAARPRSAQALAEELERAARGERVSGPARGGRWLLGAALLSAALAAGAVGWRAARGERGSGPPAPAGGAAAVPLPPSPPWDGAEELELLIGGALTRSPAELDARLRALLAGAPDVAAARAQARATLARLAPHWTRRLEGELARGAGLSTLDALAPLGDAGLDLPESLVRTLDAAIARGLANDPREGEAVRHLSGLLHRRGYLLRQAPSAPARAWVEVALAGYVQNPAPLDLVALAMACDLWVREEGVFSPLDIVRRQPGLDAELAACRAGRPRSRALALLALQRAITTTKIEEAVTLGDVPRLWPLLAPGHAAVSGERVDLGPTWQQFALLRRGQVLSVLLRAAETARWPVAACWPFRQQLIECCRALRRSEPLLLDGYRLAEACGWESTTFIHLGRFEPVAACWEETLTRVRALAPRSESLFHVLTSASYYMQVVKRYERARECAREALPLARTDEHRVKVRTNLVTAILHGGGDPEEAERELCDPPEDLPEWAELDQWYAEVCVQVALAREDLPAARERLARVERLYPLAPGLATLRLKLALVEGRLGGR